MLDFTTATRDQLKQVYNTIAKLSNDDRFFTTRELDTLPRILAPMEQVLAFSSGAMNGHTWLIVLTDQRVMFVDKGMFWGLDQLSIELNNIVSIEGKTHIMFGTIVVSDASTQHKIDNVWKSSVNYFVNKVREATSARRSGRQLVAPGSEGMGDAGPQPTTEAASAEPEPEPVDPDREFWDRQRDRTPWDRTVPDLPQPEVGHTDAPPPPGGIPDAPPLPPNSIFQVPGDASATAGDDRFRAPPARSAPAAPPTRQAPPRPSPPPSRHEPEFRPAPPPSAQAVRTDAAAAIRRLDRLLAAGAIDRRAYDAARAEIGR